MVESELFWCVVGDRVQSWFLYKSFLTEEQFKKIKKEVMNELL